MISPLDASSYFLNFGFCLFSCHDLAHAHSNRGPLMHHVLVDNFDGVQSEEERGEKTEIKWLITKDQVLSSKAFCC